MAAAAISPAPAQKGARWILSPTSDLAFIVGAPLLIAPLLYALATQLSPVAVAGFVLVTLSTAHHLPGFLRVYGDPVLFERYKFRFLLVPPLVLAVVWWVTWYRLPAVLLVSLTWAVWHGLMQVYGVMRIYAAKAGERSALTPKLDRAMCLSGFIAVLLSGSLVGERIAAAAEGSGLFGASLLLDGGLSTLAWLAFAGIAFVYVVHHGQRLARGLPVSWLKLTTLTVSLGYVYLCWSVAARNPLIGLAAFEAFHDIQYLAVAWAYNQRLAASGSGNRMLNYLFRPSAALVGVYLLVIAAYGGIAFATGQLSLATGGSGLAVTLLAAFVATSGLLHFYFDGFIWKVRQSKTKRDLGIASAAGTVAPDDTGFPPYAAWKEALQLGLILLPLVGLGALGLYRGSFELPVRGALARSFESNAGLQLQLGAAYQARGRIDEATEAYRAGVLADPDLALARHGLGSMHAMQGRRQEAIDELGTALELEPTRLDTAGALAEVLLAEQRVDEAERVLREALALTPDSPVLSDSLARALLMDSSDPARVSEAAHLAIGANRATGFQRAPALVTLARAQAAQGEYPAAIKVLERARSTPEAQASPAMHGRIVKLLAEYRRLQPDAAGDTR